MKKVYSKPEATKEELRKMLIETNEKLADLNERLVRQEKERTALIANLSHDLRAGLSVISGAVELLRVESSAASSADEPLRVKTDASAESEELLELVSKRIGHMQRLVEELFFLARLEAEESGLQLQNVDLRWFLEEYYSSVLADDHFRNRNLKLEIPADFSASVWMDPELIIRVLDNLFSNARKYSDAGAEIILSVSCADPAGKTHLNGSRENAADKTLPEVSYVNTSEKVTSDALHVETSENVLSDSLHVVVSEIIPADMPAEKNGGEVIVSVRDSGIGIDPEELSHIFERTYRSSRARTPEEGSSGLGLSIVKTIVEQHGGRVSCESEPGQGSIFRFSLKKSV